MGRSEDDTWDLASSVGATATAAAAGRALASRASDALINDPFAEALVRAVGVPFYTRVAAGELEPGVIDGAGDATFGVGRMRDLMAVRTRYFDGVVEDALRVGVRQFVIVASGLDSRAYRIAWPSDATVFEIDQPEVLQFKMASLAEIGAEAAVEHTLVPADLRQDWPTQLRRNGFVQTQPTCWILEGLLPFLNLDATIRLLDNVVVLSATGSRLACEDIQSNMRDVGKRLSVVTDQWREHGLDSGWTDLWHDGEHPDIQHYFRTLGWDARRTSAVDLFVAHGLGTGTDGSDSSALINALAYTLGIKRDGVRGLRMQMNTHRLSCEP